ncbi:MAG: cation:proton antiporter [Rhodocyclaceae bacterium]
METLFFLPNWPPAATDLSWFGVMLLCAVVLGELGHSLLRLPRITGYVLAGVILSPGVAGFWSPEMLARMQPFYDVAFGIVLFELGQRIDLGWLRRNPWLLATSIAESLLAFAFVGALLMLLDVPPLVSVLAAGLASATGPAVVLGVCGDTAARGQVTERLHLLCALSSCYSFVALGVAYAWQHQEHALTLVVTALHPMYLIVGSIILGAVIAALMLALLARMRPEQNGQTIGAIALIIAAVAIVDEMQLSVVVTLLVAGVLCRSLDKRRRMQPMDFGLIGRLALIVVFVSTGALLRPDDFVTAIVPAFGLLAARAFGKIIGVFIFARPSGLPMRKASLLSISLLPMSGAALLWVERTTAIWPELGSQLAAIVLTALVIMELLGPPALQFALRRADETTRD